MLSGHVMKALSRCWVRKHNEGLFICFLMNKLLTFGKAFTGRLYLIADSSPCEFPPGVRLDLETFIAIPVCGGREVALCGSASFFLISIHADGHREI